VLFGLLVADGWYALEQLHGTYQTGKLLDAGWLASYIGWGAAALHPSMRQLSEPGEPAGATRLSRLRLAVLAGAALVAPAVLLLQGVRGAPTEVPMIAAASAVLFGLTLLRMRSLAGQVAAYAERARLLQRFSAVIDASPVAIVELDRNERVQLWNPAAERIYGWRREEVLGRPHPASAEPGWPAIQVTATRGPGQATARLELRQHRSDGSPIDVELSTAPLRAPGGDLIGMIGVAADITERKRLAEQLRHHAFHDPLTDLANRALFHDRLEHAMARHNRTGGQLAVLLLDLDAFKTVNDALGHAVGDQLLSIVADRLRTAMRPSDTVARLGGDEFVVLIEDAAGPAEAVAVPSGCSLRWPRRSRWPTATSRSAPASASPSPGQTPSRATWSATRTWPCTRPRRMAAAATASSIRACARPWSTAPSWKPTCATPRTAASCGCATNRSSTCAPGGSPAWRPWCAGSTRLAGCWLRAASSRWPKRPATSSGSAPGCCGTPASRPASGRPTSPDTSIWASA